ncbi:MAG: hypothetical protein HUU02_10895 [Bacteroidetes bacterium]|nr:hypothetical protein [Bacteroidota bacterium]
MFNVECLSLPSVKRKKLRDIALIIRQELIIEATGFNSGVSESDKTYTEIYRVKEIKLAYGKPGKEFFLTTVRYRDGSIGSNPNDMTATLIRNNEIVANDGSFQEIFNKFKALLFAPLALELLGCLLVRNAYCLDHRKDENNNWRYYINPEILNQLHTLIEHNEIFDIEVFLYYLDMIAVNEDVKYQTLGYDISKGVGRENNMLTYANLIGVLLNRVDFIKFAGGLVRKPIGINAISLKMALKVFPQLAPTRHNLFDSQCI